jgi:hypothetical protein
MKFTPDAARAARAIRTQNERTLRELNKAGTHTCHRCGERLSGPAQLYVCPGRRNLRRWA